MNSIKVSIIIASYNSAKTIEQAISSVIEQTYPNIELLIIDGGSTDGTQNIIKKYENRIAYWVSEPDNGIYDAMNKGILKSTGEYIQIIGSDDALCNKDTIENVVSMIDNDTDILSCCEWRVNEKTHIETMFSNQAAARKEIFPMMPHGAMFVRKKIFDKYTFDMSYRISADYKFMLQCYLDNSISIKYSNLCVIYFSDAGISSNHELSEKENNLIYKELHLPFTITNYEKYKKLNEKKYKSIIKTVLPDCLLEKIKTIFYKKHHCNNKICRWCGRYGR